MKHFWILFTLTVALPSAHAQDEVPITFLHWNDFHSANAPYQIKPRARESFEPYWVGGVAYLKGFLDSLKKTHPNSVTVFAGDEWQGSPVCSITKGWSQVPILQRIRPDVLTIGNHEFDYSDTLFYRFTHDAGLNYTSSNLFWKSNDSYFVRPFIIDTVGGLTIAFMGGMTDELPRVSFAKNIDRIYATPIVTGIRQAMAQVKARGYVPDLWVAVSHNGLDEDSVLAREIPELDVIIGGHSHTPMFHESRIGKTVIVQAGSRGRYVGELSVMYSKSRRELAVRSYKLIETRHTVTPDTMLERVVREQELVVGKELGEVIGQLTVDWRVPYQKRESNLGSFEADVIREFAGADIALLNTGGLRKELAAGPITLRDVWEINPFNNSVVSLKVKGSDVIPMMTFALNNAESLTQISGLRYRARKQGAAYSIVEATVGGKPIEAGRYYLVVMNNYMASHLSDMFGLDPALHPVSDFGVSDKDVVIEGIRARKVISQGMDGRITIEE